MNRPTDYLLTTLLLLAPCLVAGALAAVLFRPSPTANRARRLTDDEVRAFYRITAERARHGQWN